MPAGGRVTALHQRVGRHDGGIGRASADDDVRPVSEGLLIRLGTEQCHDRTALIEGLFGDLRRTVKRRNLSFTILRLHRLHVLLGVDAGDFFMDAGLGADLGDQLIGHVDALIGAAGTGRADGHRDAEPVCAQYHALKIPLHIPDRILPMAGAEIVRTGIGGTRVAGNDVRFHGETGLECLFGAVETDGTIWNENLHVCHMNPPLG